MQPRRALQRYGCTPQSETPYQRAGQLWDERIGSARVQARNWRLAALGALGLSSILAACLGWLSTQSRVVPYVVEIDRHGEARAVVRADAAFQPTDPQIAWHLARFMTQIRSRSLDPVLLRENWLLAYDFVTGRGATFLSDYARASNPLAAMGDATISVQVTSVVRASERSFQVKWTETRFERAQLAETTRWTAILTIRIEPPQSAERLRRNPLGLYVDAIDWSRELETPAGADTLTPGRQRVGAARRDASNAPSGISPARKPISRQEP